MSVLEQVLSILLTASASLNVGLIIRGIQVSKVRAEIAEEMRKDRHELGNRVAGVREEVRMLREGMLKFAALTNPAIAEKVRFGE